MAALATIPDLEARIGTLTPAQNARATALLDDASALIRNHTRQEFEEATDDVAVVRGIGLVIELPQRPVTAVTAVVAIGSPPSADKPLDANDYSWDGLNKIEISPAVHWLDFRGAGTYRVTYSHGYNPIPDDVIAITCNVVNRVLTAPSLTDGMTQETVGQYTYQIQQSMGTVGAGVRLLASDKDALRKYRRTSMTVKTPLR